MHSMTGFGRGTAADERWQANVELSSVNRKQAEVVVQAPRELSELEARLRKQVLAVVSRGRVQVSITLEQAGGAAPAIRVDEGLARAFEASFIELSRVIGRDVRAEATDFLRQPGLLSIGTVEMDVESAARVIEPALAEALVQLAAMRAREGADLKQDCIDRLARLEGFAERITADAAERPARQRETLFKRLRDANLELDPSDDRVLRELALYADRCDITEELTRLDSHFAKFREYLGGAEAPGRALDFLCQELFREFNTIGSKANDAAVAQSVVEAKTELEKIREQVQNIE